MIRAAEPAATQMVDGEYPSLRPEDHSEGDRHFTKDFHSTYATILNRWLGLDPAPIVHGDYEQFAFR